MTAFLSAANSSRLVLAVLTLGGCYVCCAQQLMYHELVGLDLGIQDLLFPQAIHKYQNHRSISLIDALCKLLSSVFATELTTTWWKLAYKHK